MKALGRARLIFLVPLCLTLVLLAPTDACCARSYWTSSPGKSSVTLEFAKPKFDFSAFSTLSMVVFLGADIYVSDVLSFQTEIPYGRYAWNEEWSAYNEDGESSLGNPYFGVVLRPKRSLVEFAFGFRIPLTDGRAYDLHFYSMHADPMRLEAWVVDYFPLSAVATWRFPVGATGVEMRLITGAHWLVYTASGYDESEWFGDFGIQCAVITEPVRAKASVLFRCSLSGDDTFSGRTTFEELGFSIDAGNRVRPGLFISVPLGDDFRVLNYSYGLSVTALLE